MVFLIRRRLTRMHWDTMPDERIKNLVQVMDGYFDQGAHHLNVNVFGTREADRRYGASGERRVCKLHDPRVRLCS